MPRASGIASQMRIKPEAYAEGSADGYGYGTGAGVRGLGGEHVRQVRVCVCLCFCFLLVLCERMDSEGFRRIRVGLGWIWRYLEGCLGCLG